VAVIVAVIVIVIVAAPVIVAVHVHGNATVDVIASVAYGLIIFVSMAATLSKSSITIIVDQTIDLQDIEMRGRLHRRTPSDRVVPGLVRPGHSARPLSYVLGDGLGRSPELVGEVRMPLGSRTRRR
jgi:hypothetical protein